MISRLPRWVEYGAFILAFTAGCINAVGLLGFQHQAISHLSGTATQLGSEIVNSGLADMAHLLMVLISFLLGAAISGVMLTGRSLQLGRHYDSLLVIEGIFLLLAIYFLQQGSVYGHFFGSAACGLQNALATTYSGAVVRTTHLTGIFTDLGIMLGEAFRGKPFDNRKALLFLLIISGFIIGGISGAMLFARYTFLTLLLPASICLFLALAYRFYRATSRFGH
ncbi:YoaK family protein [Lacimicrobium alkaliphilum]|uniref:Membrane protein n=1 Tax=Lacimicrobium alkaliphilum TaxID=1526571 RepID=A0ABQ1RPA5_9ALTE|nr:YoaK family protein [Lacimicrobium alkaliphilum]GGD74232.1 membrane protein [Lacimicrobium alkaliphilum]